MNYFISSANRYILGSLYGALLIGSSWALGEELKKTDPTFLQIRFSPSLRQEDAANFDGPLDIPIKNGFFEKARFNAQIKKVLIEDAHVILQNTWVMFRASRFEYSEKKFGVSFFKAECQNIEFQWSPGDLNFRLPPNLTFTISKETKEGSKNSDEKESPAISLSVKSDHEQIKKWLRLSLAGVLEAKRIEKDLEIKASCPSNVESIVSGTLKAKLSNLSTDKDFDKILSDLAKGIEKELNALLKEHMSSHLGPWLPSVVDDTLKWRVDINEREWIVTIYETPLNARNLMLNHKFYESRQRGPNTVSFTANQAFLDKAMEHIFVKTIDTLVFDLKTPIRFEDLRGTLEELNSQEQTAELFIRFVPLRCPNPIPPRIQPFIYSDGRAHGFDATLHLEAQVIDPKDSFHILAKRKISVKAEFLLRKSHEKKSALTYMGGRWLWDAVETEECSLPRLPAQLGLSLDWALDSARLKTDIQKQIESHLPFQVTQAEPWLSYVLGTTEDKYRRELGGFYARDLVLEWKY